MSSVSYQTAMLDPRMRRQRVSSTIGAALFTMANSVSTTTGFLAIPGAEHFGIPVAQFLLWYTIVTLSTAATISLLGKLTATFGVRRVAAISGAVVAACIFALAFVDNIWVYYAICVPYGIAWAGCNILPANTLATGWHQHRRRGLMIGLVAAGTGVGGFLWGFLFPPIIADGGFRGGLITVAAIVFVLTVVNALVLVRNPPRADDAATVTVGGNSNRAALLAGFGVAVAVLTVSAFVFALEGSFPQVAAAVYAGSGIDPVTAGILVSYYSVLALIWKPVLGWIHDRFGMKVLLIVFAVTYVVGLPLIATFRSSGVWVFFVLLPIVAVALSVITMLLPLITARSVGTERFPVAYGTVMTGAFVGVSVGVPLWALSYDLTGNYDLAMYLSAFGGVLACLIAWIGFRRGSRILGQKLQEAHLDEVDAGLATELAADAADDEPTKITVTPSER